VARARPAHQAVDPSFFDDTRRALLAYLERTLATIQVPFKKGQWGKMRRKGAAAVATPDPAVTAPPS
jgi:hypothetical protein